MFLSGQLWIVNNHQSLCFLAACSRMYIHVVFWSWHYTWISVKPPVRLLTEKKPHFSEYFVSSCFRSWLMVLGKCSARLCCFSRYQFLFCFVLSPGVFFSLCALHVCFSTVVCNWFHCGIIPQFFPSHLLSWHSLFLWGLVVWVFSACRDTRC
jgi:hypothetical protein